MLFEIGYQIHFLHHEYFKYALSQHFFKSQFSHYFEQQYLKTTTKQTLNKIND